MSRGNVKHFGSQRGIVLAMPRALAVALRGLLGADHDGVVDPTFASLVAQLDRQLARPVPPTPTPAPPLSDLLSRAAAGDGEAAIALLRRITSEAVSQATPRRAKRGGR